MVEEFRDIDSMCGHYKVSNMGNVLSARSGKLLKPFNVQGYLHVRLKDIQLKIHRLVGKAFIPNPLDKPQINHKDGNKENNCVDNLEWCTRSENVLHSFRVLGRKPVINKHVDKQAKIVFQYSLSGEPLGIYNSIKECSRILNIDTADISKCMSGKRKTAGGFIFRKER